MSVYGRPNKGILSVADTATARGQVIAGSSINMGTEKVGGSSSRVYETVLDWTGTTVTIMV